MSPLAFQTAFLVLSCLYLLYSEECRWPVVLSPLAPRVPGPINTNLLPSDLLFRRLVTTFFTDKSVNLDEFSALSMVATTFAHSSSNCFLFARSLAASSITYNVAVFFFFSICYFSHRSLDSFSISHCILSSRSTYIPPSNATIEMICISNVHI